MDSVGVGATGVWDGTTTPSSITTAHTSPIATRWSIVDSIVPAAQVAALEADAVPTAEAVELTAQAIAAASTGPVVLVVDPA